LGLRIEKHTVFKSAIPNPHSAIAQMSEALLRQAAQLMQEQAAAYRRLDAACNHLSAALVRGEPSVIESLTRAGESELLKMRSRLLQLMSVLTTFADSRARSSEGGKLAAETREIFEVASNELLGEAHDFEQTSRRAGTLANHGSTFVTACIQNCGIQPTTYRAPYARRGEVRAWA
jgi:hypothetical protein